MPYYPPSVETSAATTSFLAGGDIEAQTVQAAIAEVAKERAKSGENTDITSLGVQNQALTIKSQLNLPFVSRFSAYKSQPQSINSSNVFSKVILESGAFDNLGEYQTGTFFAKSQGFYLFSGAAAVEKSVGASPDWRVILSLFVNGLETIRGSDIYVPALYGGGSMTGLCQLNLNDYVELFLYSSYPCTLFLGAAVTYLTGTRLG